MTALTTPSFTDFATDISLAELRDITAAYWHDHHLLDDLDKKKIRKTTARILDAAENLNLATLDGLLSHAGAVLPQVTGLKNTTQYLSEKRADKAHRTRNILGALPKTAAMAYEAGTVPGSPSLPDLAPRHGGRGRALHDDEILLLRLRALHVFHEPSRHLAACQYALTEAGARPSETTRVQVDHFDDVHAPTTVHVPGVTGQAKARTIPVPRWSRPLLTQALAAHIARHGVTSTSTLLYTGNHPAGGAKASASASGNLTRAMKEAGLARHSAKPTGIVLWRAHQTLVTEGPHQAVALTGHLSIRALYRFLEVGPPPR